MLIAMDEIDRRSEQLVGLSREALAIETRRWPVAEQTPQSVQDLLLDARQLFVGGAVTYSSFAIASLRALQAAERALKLLIGSSKEVERMTLGQLLRYEQQHPVLSPEAQAWFSELGLRFRNNLSHPERVVAFTPGIAELVLRTAHEHVAAMFSSDPVGGEVAPTADEIALSELGVEFDLGDDHVDYDALYGDR